MTVCGCVCSLKPPPTACTTLKHVDVNHVTRHPAPLILAGETLRQEANCSDQGRRLDGMRGGLGAVYILGHCRERGS